MESPDSSPGLEKLRRASLPSSPPALSLDPTSLLRRDALLSPQHLQTLRQEQEEDSAGKLSVTEDEDFLEESVKEYSVEEFKEMDWSQQIEDEDCEEVFVEEQEENLASDLEEKDSLEEEKEYKEVDSVKEESEKEGVKKEELSHLDLAESWPSWRERHRGVVMGPKSFCKLCESGSENFKYGPSKCRDLIKSLEDLAEQLYIWKRPGVAYGGRKHEAGYNSMANERRSAMKHHGLDVTCVST